MFPWEKNVKGSCFLITLLQPCSFFCQRRRKAFERKQNVYTIEAESCFYLQAEVVCCKKGLWVHNTHTHKIYLFFHEIANTRLIYDHDVVPLLFPPYILYNR